MRGILQILGVLRFQVSFVSSVISDDIPTCSGTLVKNCNLMSGFAATLGTSGHCVVTFPGKWCGRESRDSSAFIRLMEDRMTPESECSGTAQ